MSDKENRLLAGFTPPQSFMEVPGEPPVSFEIWLKSFKIYMDLISNESLGDDIREEHNRWNIWEEDYR